MFGFGRCRPAPQIADDIRRTIALLHDQRRLAADTAGRALVNQAEVRHACQQQLATLAAASGVAENAETMARRAAGAARDEADSDDAVFTQTAAGLRTVQDALGAAADPIHALLAGATDNTEQARQVLVRARLVLDEQIREQLRLLAAFEQVERARVVAEFRRRR